MTPAERQVLHDAISGLAVLRLKSEHVEATTTELPPDVRQLLQLVIDTSQTLQQAISPLLAVEDGASHDPKNREGE